MKRAKTPTDEDIQRLLKEEADDTGSASTAPRAPEELQMIRWSRSQTDDLVSIIGLLSLLGGVVYLFGALAGIW